MAIGRLGLLLSFAVIAGCKILIIVPEHGRVVTTSGAFECNAGETCEIDVVDIFFNETYVAEPTDGYVFGQWRKEAFYFCGGLDIPCPLFTSLFEGNDILMGILESDQKWFLEPVFERSDIWATRADMPTPRLGHASCTVDAKIYVFGGRPGLRADIPLDSVEEYDPESNTWAVKKGMPSALQFLSASAVNGKCYVIGGQLANIGPVGVATVNEYDPLTDSWQSKAPLPSGRVAHSAAVVNGKIYVIGGISFVIGTSSMLVYDPATNTWEERTAMPTPRAFFGAVSTGGKIYAIGGTTNPNNVGGNEFSVVESYDPATDTWTTRAPMPTARLALATGVVNGKIYAIGGGTHYVPVDRRLDTWDGTTFSIVEEFDPETNTWTPRASMPEVRAHVVGGGSVVGGRIYVIGGARTLEPHPGLSTNEEYTPPVTQP